MPKKDRYIFPAVFDYADDGISIDFPDIPGCLSCAFSTDEALHNAHEALGLHLFNMEADGDKIPEPSNVLDIRAKLKRNQIVVPIEVNMLIVRDSVNNKAMNKMCTLPQWLLTEGREAGLNFSQVLQDALVEKLGITREIKRRKN